MPTPSCRRGKSTLSGGKGVSQGHSDAIRRVPGVKNAIQYTIPVAEAVEEVRSGIQPDLTTRQKHLRECFVVAEDGADLAAIESAIVSMPNYFSDYDTTVHFISEEELKTNHSAMAHGGFVIRTGKTGMEQQHNHGHRVFLKAGFQPGIYFLHHRGIRTRGIQDEPGRPEGLQDRL